MKPVSLLPKKSLKPQPEGLAMLETFWTLPPAELLAALHTTPQGLQKTEAERRLKQFGPNALKAQRQTTWLWLLLSQFKSPLVLILIFAALISAFVGEWTDAIIVLVVVLGSTLLGFVQEYRASNAVEKLRSQVTIKSSVLRGGQAQTIPSTQVVPGDVVLLSYVPFNYLFGFIPLPAPPNLPLADQAFNLVHG